MANAAARWSFCGPSIFFALAVFLLCFSSVVAGHSIVLRKRDAPGHQLAVREFESFRITTVTTEFATVTSVTTLGASVTPAPSGPVSSALPSASASLAPGSKASSSSIQVTSRSLSTSSITSSSPSSTPSQGSQQTPGSTGRFVLSFTPPASKKTSATPSSSVLPSQPSAPASVNSPNFIPFTTFVVPTQGLASFPSSVFPSPPIETTASSTSSTPVVAAAEKSSGFWHKKSAVAAVFVIVSLVAVGTLIVAFIVLRKRHRARKLREDHADLWEKFSDNSHRTRSNSPGPSINAAPLDAFAARDDSYIPATREADFGHQLNISSYSSTPIQHPDYYTNNPPTHSQQPSAIPSRAGPSATLREAVGRASYQQSIDSFYGATGRAL